MNIKKTRAAVDGFACTDDFSHAELCADRLLSYDYDNTATRALWQSALISMRRAMANGHSMLTDEGGPTAKPFNRNQAKEHLPSDLHGMFDDFLKLADKCVAHRKPIEGVRTVKIQVNDVLGDVELKGQHMLPSDEQRRALKKIAESLKNAALNAAATALNSSNTQCS